MATLFEVDPETFINQAASEPANGRGAWTRKGIDFDYRYSLAPKKSLRIGKRCEVSLDHWAVAAGVWAIQRRLRSLGYMDEIPTNLRGIFNYRTKQAVKRFQADNRDPDGGAELVVDGTVGRSDARALWTPVIDKAERMNGIPNHLLLGETNHESALDPGAIGYYIYYPGYRGVDRGMSQINSLYNPQVSWMDAYHPHTSINWSGERLRSYYNKYKKDYPDQPDDVLWDAAVCAHNNPSAAGTWARTGNAPTEQAAGYVQAVKNAIY
jgi:peptidoglycan hydrolase-like protein with peptidoglycan-binding domain